MADDDDEPDVIRRADGSLVEIDWQGQDEIVRTTFGMAEFLLMPAEHLVEVERLKDQLGSFAYNEIGVLVIRDPDGGELARVV